jgi:nitrate/nitrite-specific signal transduction histidine kinase
MFLARRMVVPIHALRAGAARLGGGDLGQRIAIKTGDEVEALANQFNDMAGRLQESYANLERKVEERTQELHQRTDELGRSVGELRALGEVSQAVNSTLDLETVLSTIVAKAVPLSDTDAGAIYVYDEAQREFHLRATYGMDQELIHALKHQQIRFNEPNIAAVLSQREPIQVADLREGASSALNNVILRAGFRALLLAPLSRGEEIVGMLVVRRRTPGAFPQNTVDLIKTFAAQSVLAIQNARLFHEIEDKGRQLEVAGQHKSRRRGAIGRLRLVRGLRRCRRSDQLTRPYDGRGLGAARQQTVVPDPVEPVWQDVHEEAADKLVRSDCDYELALIGQCSGPPS